MISSRAATEHDSIAGVMPKMVHVPETIEEAASQIRECEQKRETLAFIGGGTKLDLGLPPDRLDAVIRTEKLRRVIEYAPSDQIINVEAGMALSELQATVASHRQRLALDPPLGDRATIGGIIAANAFGPLRTRFGSVRDVIIGISIIRADGVVARGGGKVVKNVAGFDLPKLMAGSLGTLGMIASATFRLHPIPESIEVLRIEHRSASDVRTLVRDIRQAQLEPAAIIAIDAAGGFEIALRFEGFGPGVTVQCERLSKLAIGCERLQAAEAERIWRRHDEIRTTGPLRIKITALPSAIEMVSRDILPALRRTLRDAGFVWYPTAGVGFVSGKPASAQETAEAIRRTREMLQQAGGSLVIEASPADVRKLVDVWGEVGGALRVMRSMKERFDPERRLTPGRFVGGI